MKVFILRLSSANCKENTLWGEVEKQRHRPFASRYIQIAIRIFLFIISPFPIPGVFLSRTLRASSPGAFCVSLFQELTNTVTGIQPNMTNFLQLFADGVLV